MIILTDLSDVLIGGLGDAAKLIATRFGEGNSKKCWERIQKTKDDYDDVLRGYMEEKGYYRIFFAGSNFCFGHNDMYRVFSDAFKVTIPGTLKLYQRITSYPQRLKKDAPMVEGMPSIYLVSDHIRERQEEIERLHPEIFRVIKDAFWSFDLGALKSDYGFFFRLLDKLEVSDDEVVFIDDNAQNIQCARRAGITSIQFTDAVTLEEELKKLGFVIAPSIP